MSETTSALSRAAQFLRVYKLRVLGISAAILIPCFWHRRILSSDMGSHLYNAWLAQLIHRGQAPGLSFNHPWTNILFDYVLSGLGTAFGFDAAEKIGAALAVLIFFWGAFALVSAAGDRAPWFLLPCLALATYGWTFQVGFFNYYISLGLSFLGLAIFWRGKGWERALPIVLIPLMLAAHPLGVLWLAGAAAYVRIAQSLRPRYHVFLLLIATAVIYAGHYYFFHRHIGDPENDPIYLFNGADQLLLFNVRYLPFSLFNFRHPRVLLPHGRYAWPAWGILLFAVLSIIADAVRRRTNRESWADYAIPLQLYVVVEIGVFLLPKAVHFPQTVPALALLTERLTSVSAITACCILAVMRPSRWHLTGSAVVAVIFFSLLYRDTGSINKMEAQAEELVRTLPPGQRVTASIFFPDNRVMVQHMIDRACIGYCFSYGNYEPSTGMFRVRADDENPYVLSDYEDAISTEEGDYTVQPEDLPVWQVYQCSMKGTELCISPIEAGEENDHLGVHANQIK